MTGAAFVAALGVQLLVLYAPSVPGEPLFPHVDLVVHAAVFAAPALLALLAGVPSTPLLGLLGAHAVVSEVVQHVALPGRTGASLDVVADLAGIALGALLAREVARRRGRPATVPGAGGHARRW